MTDVPFLTSKQLCQRWLGRIAEKTLANWRCADKGPRFSRMGSRILYPLESVLAWEAEQGHQSTGEYSTRAVARATGAIIETVEGESANRRARRQVAKEAEAALRNVDRMLAELSAQRAAIEASYKERLERVEQSRP